MSVPLKCNEWPILSSDEINAKVSTLPRWTLIAENNIPKLKTVFATSNFKTALDIVNKAGDVAENQGHHPGM